MRDPHKSPLTAAEQDAPEPERLITPEEEAGMDLAELEDPPQAEGARDLDEDERMRAARHEGGTRETAS